jgi:hypothetical protein
MRAGRWLRAFVAFWVDFIVGDDWTVAAVVALALLGTWGLVHLELPAWWLLPTAVIAVTGASCRRAARAAGGRAAAAAPGPGPSPPRWPRLPGVGRRR